jgi:cation transport ATPase
MDNQPTENQSNGNSSQPEAFESRRERRAARRGGEGAWIIGVVLVILGIVFLLQNMGAVNLKNWWALFIMIPALGAFGDAWRTYQNAGKRLTSKARGSMFVGVLLTMVSAAFLFNLNWTYLGPILIILAGAGLLANAFLSREE